MATSPSQILAAGMRSSGNLSSIVNTENPAAEMGKFFDRYNQEQMQAAKIAEGIRKEDEELRRYDERLRREDARNLILDQRYIDELAATKEYRDQQQKNWEAKHNLDAAASAQTAELNRIKIDEAKRNEASQKALDAISTQEVNSALESPVYRDILKAQDRLWSVDGEAAADPVAAADRFNAGLEVARPIDKSVARKRLTDLAIRKGATAEAADAWATLQMSMSPDVEDFAEKDAAARKEYREEQKASLDRLDKLSDFVIPGSNKKAGFVVVNNSDGTPRGTIDNTVNKTIEHLAGTVSSGNDKSYVARGLTEASLELLKRFTSDEVNAAMPGYLNSLRTDGVFSGGYDKIKGTDKDIVAGFPAYMDKHIGEIRRQAVANATTSDPTGLRDIFLADAKQLFVDSAPESTADRQRRALLQVRNYDRLPTAYTGEDTYKGSLQNTQLRDQDKDLRGEWLSAPQVPRSEVAANVLPVPAQNLSDVPTVANRSNLTLTDLGNVAIERGVDPKWVSYKVQQGDLAALAKAAETGSSSALYSLGASGALGLRGAAKDVLARLMGGVDYGTSRLLYGATDEQATNDIHPFIKWLQARGARDMTEANRLMSISTGNLSPGRLRDYINTYGNRQSNE